MAKGRRVGAIAAIDLAGLLGSDVEIRRSEREGAKYPLYLSTCIGPLHMNTKKAQDYLLENATMDGPNGPENPKPVRQVEVDPKPVRLEVVEESKSPIEKPVPEPEPPENPYKGEPIEKIKKRSFFAEDPDLI